MRYGSIAAAFALPVAFAVTLGAAPQTAEAGKVCNKLNLGSPCVVRSDIAKNAIVSSRVKNESLRGEDILDGSLTGADIQDGAIGAAHIATDAVGTAAIADGSITGTDIAANAITAGNIAAGAIGTSEIADGTVTGTDIAAGTITAGNIAAGAIGASEIADGAVTAADIADEPGADFVWNSSFVNLTSADKTILTLTVTAPRAGFLVVTANGFLIHNASGTNARCGITTGSSVPIGSEIWSGPSSSDTQPFSFTRFFAATQGSNTWKLVCDQNLGGSGLVDIWRPYMIAMYFPSQI